MRLKVVLAAAAMTACVLMSSSAFGQSRSLNLEVGGQFVILHQDNNPIFDLRGAPTQWDPGVGVRLGLDITRFLEIEGEFNVLPKDDRLNGRITEGLFGVKAGYGGKRFGLFAKVRPGFIHARRTAVLCEGSPIVGFGACGSAGGRTDFALDMGGVVEFYPSKRTIVRFDAGDLFEHSRRQRFSIGPPFFVSGFLPSDDFHQLQMSLGVGFRF